jgi:hypothetical protein
MSTIPLDRHFTALLQKSPNKGVHHSHPLFPANELA